MWIEQTLQPHPRVLLRLTDDAVEIAVTGPDNKVQTIRFNPKSRRDAVAIAIALRKASQRLEGIADELPRSEV